MTVLELGFRISTAVLFWLDSCLWTHVLHFRWPVLPSGVAFSCVEGNVWYSVGLGNVRKPCFTNMLIFSGALYHGNSGHMTCAVTQAQSKCSLKSGGLGAEEMAQEAKCLSYKHRDLSSEPQQQHRKPVYQPSMTICLQLLGEREKDLPRASWTASLPASSGFG